MGLQDLQSLRTIHVSLEISFQEIISFRRRVGKYFSMTCRWNYETRRRMSDFDDGLMIAVREALQIADIAQYKLTTCIQNRMPAELAND